MKLRLVARLAAAATVACTVVGVGLPAKAVPIDPLGGRQAVSAGHRQPISAGRVPVGVLPGLKLGVPAATSTGAQVRTAASAVDSAKSKGVRAKCPAGTRVLGGGARIQGGGGKVVLVQSRPVTHATGAADEYFALAYERPILGHSADWYVQAFAVCGSPLPGFEVVRGYSDLPWRGRLKTAKAQCPTGKVVIGMGGIVSDTYFNGHASFQSINPEAGGTRVSVSGIEDAIDGASIPDFRVHAYAICAFKPAGWTIVSSLSSTGFEKTKLQYATCPVGTRAHSAGITKQDPDGHSHLEELVVSNWRHVYARGTSPDLVSQPWNLAAWVICAN